MKFTDQLQFTHHNIRLDDGTLTKPDFARSMEDYPYFRSARGILEAVFPGDKSRFRLVDLGCLEGGYAVEFARLGFQVLGVEVRELNIAACNYVKSKTNLPNLEFVQDNALNVASYGVFDAVFCSGLLYHFDEPKRYLETLSSVTNKLVIIQTQFSLVTPTDAWLKLSTRMGWVFRRVMRKSHPTHFALSAPAKHEGLAGRWYTEFGSGRSFGKRETAKWSSWDNRRSFWIQREYLLGALQEVGFDVVLEQYDHLLPNITEGLTGGAYQANLRGMFIGIKTGDPVPDTKMSSVVV